MKFDKEKLQFDITKLPTLMEVKKKNRDNGYNTIFIYPYCKDAKEITNNIKLHVIGNMIERLVDYGLAKYNAGTIQYYAIWFARKPTEQAERMRQLHKDGKIPKRGLCLRNRKEETSQ